MKTWRNRIYYYSSGTTFDAISVDLALWMTRHSPTTPSDDNEEEASAWEGPDVNKLLKNVIGLCHMCV